MKQAVVAIPVTVIEASDLKGISEEARVTGELADHRARLQAQFDRNQTVEVGLAPGKYGAQPWVRVAGVQLEEGDGIAFADFIPGGVMLVPAAELPKEPAVKPAKKVQTRKMT